MPIRSPKSCFGHITLRNFQLIIPRPQVDLGEDLCSTQLIKDVINSWQRVLVLNGHLVYLLVVYAQPERTDLLLDKEYRCALGWYTESNKTLIHQVPQLHFQLLQLSWCHPVGGIEIGAVLGNKGMANSSSRYGGSPGNFSGKTSGNSFTTEISSKRSPATLVLLTCAKNA